MQRIARLLGARPNKPKHTGGTGSTTALNIPSTDVGYEQELIVSNITGSYVAIVKQEVDNAWVELDSREITATGLYTLEFTPTTTNVKLDIINTNTGSYTHALRLTGPAGWKDKDVLPLARTYTICDRPRDSYRFGFNGQEKDNEIAGIGNFNTFGARELDARIGRWWGLDPLFKKQADKSPYNAYSNSPIARVDPGGKTDFWFMGKWVGTDGKQNGLIGIVKDKSASKEIKSATSEGKPYTTFGDIDHGSNSNSVFVVHKDVLALSYHALRQAITHGERKEFNYAMDRKGDRFEKVFEGVGPELKTLVGAGRVDGVNFPAKGDVSIHSHATGVDVVGADIGSSNAAVPTVGLWNGNGDLLLFQNFKMNVIVGKNGEPYRESSAGKTMAVDNRGEAINFFDQAGHPQATVSGSDAADILKDDKGKAGKQYQEKQN